MFSTHEPAEQQVVEVGLATRATSREAEAGQGCAQRSGARPGRRRGDQPCRGSQRADVAGWASAYVAGARAT